MRICFISHSAYLGGAERALLEAIRALSKRGVGCHVLVPYEGPLCEELDKLKVSFRVVKYRSWLDKENSPWLRRAINLLISLVMVIPAATAIILWRSTIVYTNTLTIFTGALAALLTRRPHIWHIHEFGCEDHHLTFAFGKRLSLGFMNRLSVQFIAASKAIADAYQRFIPPSKLKVIYQSVSIASPISTIDQTSSFKCLIAGKISEGKNQLEAVEAVGELARKGMHVELYIIGDGFQDYIALLNDAIKKNSIQNNVKLLGYRKDAFNYMCMADVILMCSISEGFGRVTIEGMLAGKPIIGGRGGATTELIQDGITGLLYTTGNYKELAKKIEYLYSNPIKTKVMGKNAKEWALNNFTEDRYGEELMHVLLNVAKSGVKKGKSSVKASTHYEV